MCLLDANRQGRSERSFPDRERFVGPRKHSGAPAGSVVRHMNEPQSNLITCELMS